MFSLFKSDVSRNVIKPFFDELAKRTQTHFLIDTNNDATAYRSHCTLEAPGIVIAPYPVARLFMKNCQFKAVAVSHQVLQLYVRKDNPDPTPTAVRKLGTLRSAHANLISQEELSQINNHFDVVGYADFYSLITNYKKDQVDALAMREGADRAISLMKESWKPIMTFQQRGLVFAMVSTQLDPGVTQAFIQMLLGQDGSSTEVFVDNMALGGFQLPTPAELSGLSH